MVLKKESDFKLDFLTISDLYVDFPTEDGLVKAVNGVDLSITEDEVLGLIGESGCGKSVLGLSIMVSHIEIGRVKTDKGHDVKIVAFVAHPGVVIGQDGANIARIRKELGKIVKSGTLHIDVVDVKNPDLDATLVAKWIASELENRASYRATQKKAIQRMRKAGAKGCRTICGGRLGGAEIARSEGYKEGVVPLHTLRADIDFAHIDAATAYGRIGVKVWICRSVNKEADEQLAKKQEQTESVKEEAAPRGDYKNAAAKAR